MRSNLSRRAGNVAVLSVDAQVTSSNIADLAAAQELVWKLLSRLQGFFRACKPSNNCDKCRRALAAIDFLLVLRRLLMTR